MTNNINDYQRVVSFEGIVVGGVCDETRFVVGYTDIPAGYYIFVDGFTLFYTTDDQTTVISYYNNGICNDGSEISENKVVAYGGGGTPGEDDSNGNDVVYTTVTYDGSTTRTTTLPMIQDMEIQKPFKWKFQEVQ